MKSLVCSFAFGLVIAGVIQGLKGFEERIYHGDVATRGQFPWTAYLNITTGNGDTTQCTGTFISDRYIITAAHCVQNAESIIVFLGMQRTDDENGTMKYIVEKDGITLYPTWDPKKGTDNLALLRLPSAVDLYKYEYVDFIRLPVRSSSSQYADKEAIATGWGDYNNTRMNSVELRFTPVEIMSKKECRKFLRPHHVPEGLICIEKSENRGPCLGDNGGPLTLNNTNNDPVLVGVNSYTLGPCSSRIPAIYSYIGYSRYLDWIHATAGIGSLGVMDPTTAAPK